MKIREIFEGIDLIKVDGDMDREISAVCYDSRQVKNGSIFVAVKGLKSDGHNFLNDAVEKGARAVVVENNSRLPTPDSRLPTIISVPDSRKALALISDRFYCHPSEGMSIIGITGTNGKTTTSYLINSILGVEGFKTGIVGTIDYRFNGEIIPAPHTTPESLDLHSLFKRMADRKVKYCVMEVSSHSLELDRVYGTRFETGVFTNLTQDHLDFHGTMERYFDAKARLFRRYGLKKAAVNIDDPYGRRLLKDINAGRVLTYGIEERADVMARDVSLSMRGLNFFADTPAGRFEIGSGLMGRHNVYNILAAISTCLLEGFSNESIAKGVMLLDAVPGRLENIDEGQDFTVLVDYAHTDDALKNVLDAVRGLPHNKIFTVFGCGGERDRGKRPLMGRVGVEYSDFAIITSDNPRSEDPAKIIEDIERGILTGWQISKPVNWTKIPDRREAIEFAVSRALGGDIVVIAGKGHEDYQILRDRKIHFDDREVAREAIRKGTRAPVTRAPEK
ncbi:MAG: UDP-N-acetylmuramoyl-L-alanyl-D-glutamate--2,6-diaminopimelate ligase [Nitrospinae bacterium]|nr:UDP-N-acetylmuramoyl-L-alanyl-D-glutamate--2,6-diaminopimelate ligase [Nitrospinota bacterium]